MRCWQQAEAVFVRAPAKLNLFLEIHARRPDGYHELETLMVRIGIYDTLCFEEEDSEESHLRLLDAGGCFPGMTNRRGDVPQGSDNLILQAVRALQQYAGVDRQVRITVWKRIPVASGLAGGSSDAAATLLGLNHLWGLQLSRAELLHLGASLGSDINFFLAETSAAVCRGRGEIIQPVVLPVGLAFVVVRPFGGLSTAAVFRQCQVPAKARSVQPLLVALREGQIHQAGRLMHNALQEPAEVLHSEISTLRKRFRALTLAGHQMTGSGTAYFGLCPDRRVAHRIAGVLRAERRGEVFATQSVT